MKISNMVNMRKRIRDKNKHIETLTKLAMIKVQIVENNITKTVTAHRGNTECLPHPFKE